MMTNGRLVVRELLSGGAGFDRLDWKPFRPGIEIVRFYGDGRSGPSAGLLRYAPGARVPRHEHCGIEHIFVLEGSQEDESAVYGAGTLLISGEGTRHRVASEAGCVVLAVWQAPVRFLEGEDV